MARRRSGGLRGRLDRLEGNAHATMGQAQFTLAAIREAATGFLEELQDGVTVKVVRLGDASIMDFFSGKVKELPFSLQLVVEEPEDASPQ